jgi:hypothetical protein
MLLLHLGDQNIARHDFWHPFGELQDVVPDPARRDLVGGKRFIRALSNTLTLMSTSGPPSNK